MKATTASTQSSENRESPLKNLTVIPAFFSLDFITTLIVKQAHSFCTTHPSLCLHQQQPSGSCENGNRKHWSGMAGEKKKNLSTKAKSRLRTVTLKHRQLSHQTALPIHSFHHWRLKSNIFTLSITHLRTMRTIRIPGTRFVFMGVLKSSAFHLHTRENELKVSIDRWIDINEQDKLKRQNVRRASWSFGLLHVAASGPISPP